VSTTTPLVGAQEGFVLSHTLVAPIIHWPEMDISHILPKPCESRMVSILKERSPLPFQHGRELTPIPEDTPTEVIDNDSSRSHNPECQAFIGAIVPAISEDEQSINEESATTRAARLERNHIRSNRCQGRDLMRDFDAVGGVFNTPAANIIAATRLLNIAGSTLEF